ncbi:hypothetical protein B0H11DRAFT_2230832 [Mycena galericulata]|nr:hypothetical protein B0H11DRAFT_2230832 [Mycena galericulata]
MSASHRSPDNRSDASDTSLIDIDPDPEDHYRACPLDFKAGNDFVSHAEHSANTRKLYYMVRGGRDGALVLYSDAPDALAAMRGRDYSTREPVYTKTLACDIARLHCRVTHAMCRAANEQQNAADPDHSSTSAPTSKKAQKDEQNDADADPDHSSTSAPASKKATAAGVLYVTDHGVLTSDRSVVKEFALIVGRDVWPAPSVQDAENYLLSTQRFKNATNVYYVTHCGHIMTDAERAYKRYVELDVCAKKQGVGIGMYYAYTSFAAAERAVTLLRERELLWEPLEGLDVRSGASGNAGGSNDDDGQAVLSLSIPHYT